MSYNKFSTCEICFPCPGSARAAMAELAGLGIQSKIFDDVVDRYSAAVFVGAWSAVDASFEQAVSKVADQHGGSADCFAIDDREPMAIDFGFAPPAA
jgi:hypothetical protein